MRATRFVSRSEIQQLNDDLKTNFSSFRIPQNIDIAVADVSVTTGITN